MNLYCAETEEHPIPNKCFILDISCKAHVCAFNGTGTLLAIGGKNGLITLMDFLTKIVVKNLPLPTGEKTVSRGNHNHNKVDSMEWSKDGEHLLALYSGLKKIIIWDIFNSVSLREFEFDSLITKLELHPQLSTTQFCLISGRATFIYDTVNQEEIKFIEQLVPGVGDEGSLQNLLPSPNVKKDDPGTTGSKSERPSAKKTGRNIPQLFFSHFNKSGDGIVTVAPNNMIYLIKHDHFKNFVVCSSVPIVSNSYVTSSLLNDRKDSLLLNCIDRNLRLYVLDFESPFITLEKEFFDVINKKKWMSASFFGGFSGDEKILGGIGESGSHEIYVQEKKQGVILEKLSAPQEGIHSLLTHPLHPSMILVITTSGHVLLWLRTQEADWASLAPEFREVDENEYYVEAEDEFDVKVKGIQSFREEFPNIDIEHHDDNFLKKEQFPDSDTHFREYFPKANRLLAVKLEQDDYCRKLLAEIRAKVHYHEPSQDEMLM